MRNAFLERLSHVKVLGEKELRIVDDLCSHRRDVPAKKYISRDGDQMVSFPVILSGWAARYQILRNGARQITRLLLPGDAFFFDSSPDSVAIEEVITLGSCKVASIAHADMNLAMERHPTIAEAMRRYGCMENAIMASWIVNVGRRDALERMAHLICETHFRLAQIGAADADQFYFPLTQDDFADVLGLTPVHINRKLQQLRQEELISLRSKQLKILDVRELQQVAGFDPAYLAAGARIGEGRLGAIAA